MGLLSSYEEIREGGRGNGRVGLYDDSLPVQIAVVAELKKDFHLNTIKEMKKGGNTQLSILLNQIYRDKYKEIEEKYKKI